MNIEIKTNYTTHPAEVRVQELSNLIKVKLDGSDYERGQLEEIVATIEKHEKYLISLTEAFIQNGMLTKPQQTELFCEYDDEVV